MIPIFRMGSSLHALETEHNGHPINNNLVEVDGRKYAVYVGKRVSLAHQSQIHGPAYVGDSTFIGMQSLIFKAKVGNNCVVEPKSLVLGVTIADRGMSRRVLLLKHRVMLMRYLV
jgi:carbonic anhydrase/acetyltransferase-like protein (isoleucine patch superfamily)